MAIRTKTEKEIEIMRGTGARLAEVLRIVGEHAKPGVSTAELNSLTHELIGEIPGDTPSFYKYKPAGARRPFPAAICISINDEVVHGIPNENARTLESGDIVALDAGITREGLVVDSTITVGVGEVDEKGRRLIEAARVSLERALSAAKAGNKVGDISHAIQTYAEGEGYALPWEFGGHGVGYGVHEEPFVPNLGEPGTGAVLVENMVLAIEPILVEGSAEVVEAGDGYTFNTRDGSRSAEFEHTIVITKGEPIVLTRE